MNKDIEEVVIEEVVKEYIMFVPDLDFRVKGRITKSTNQEGQEEFHWGINHHYRPSETAHGVYYPSKLTTNSFRETELLLMSYMEGFTTIDVTPNKLY